MIGPCPSCDRRIDYRVGCVPCRYKASAAMLALIAAAYGLAVVLS